VSDEIKAKRISTPMKIELNYKDIYIVIPNTVDTIGEVQIYNSIKTSVLKKIVVYSKEYDDYLENDVQSIFIKNAKMDMEILKIVNEKNYIYFLNIGTILRNLQK
jgi:hypothetical protein